MENKKNLSRRHFLKTTGLAAAGITILPSGIYGQGISPSDKLNIVGIGVGGRGANDIDGLFDGGNVNIVALCDVDSEKAAGVFKRYPKAKVYEDYRKMYEKEMKNFDAIMVATPDHSHALAALPAMVEGKHAYIEKPLAHNIKEARLLTETAAKHNLVTQMGNQGSSGDGTRQVTEWINAGLIGDVTKVHCWTNRPIWPQGVPSPTEKVAIPSSFNWDLWLGPAKYREYNPAYTHFKWRGWWDYGTGALGDMACHIVDTPFNALNLGSPISAEASVSQIYTSDFVEANYTASCPPSSKVHINFPKRGDMPGVELVWYDGGMMPARPIELQAGDAFGNWDGGVLFEGSKGKIVCEVYGGNPKLLVNYGDEISKLVKETIKRVPEGHHQNFVNGCINGTPTSSPFSIAGPLTETILMGNLAIRSFNEKVLKPGKKLGDWAPFTYPGRTRLEWDGKKMEVTNLEMANQFVNREYRKGWELPNV